MKTKQLINVKEKITRVRENKWKYERLNNKIERLTKKNGEKHERGI